MPREREISFATENIIRYRSNFDTVNCEKVYMADVDSDGRPDIVIPRSSSSNDRSLAEIAVYNSRVAECEDQAFGKILSKRKEEGKYSLDLSLKASDHWEGTIMDVIAADVDRDGSAEIIAAGGIKNSAPVIRVYKYNENYKGNLELSSQTSWASPEGMFSTAKAIHVAVDEDSQMEIAVLTIVEGNRENTGYAQLRLYDADMRLQKVARWTPMGGNIVKWGHCMTAADIDGDGYDELIVLINFRHEGKQKSDLRAFDRHLVLKRKCEMLADESLFATCMSAGDVDRDGRTDLGSPSARKKKENTVIVVAGGIFTEVWQGATNQLMVFDGDLNLRTRTTWKTFRHSWVWDLQICDIDNDGDQEIITYGGTSMRGRNQGDANIMGEIRLWDSASLSTKDMFVWQSKPGEDTRPSRGFAFKDSQEGSLGGKVGVCEAKGDSRICLVTATSRWSRRQRGEELEIRTLNYEPAVTAIKGYSDLIKAYDERNIEALKDTPLAPIAMEALAVIGGTEAVKAIGGLLTTQDQPFFLRAVELLRDMEAEGVNELQGIGFTIPDDWIIVSPFDNTDNSGFDMQYPPETGIDLDAFYAGKDRIVRWGKIDYYRQDAYINLAYTHFESFERTGIEFNWNVLRTESVAYALTHICSPASMEAQIRIGSADGVKVWLRNELKYSENKTGQAVPDQAIIPVSLDEGRNEVLLKVANYKTDGWGFYFRVTDPEGRPISNLRYERPEVSHVHNQMLACEQLLPLLEVRDEHLRYLAASQLALSLDKRGNEALSHLLRAEEETVRAKAAFALTLAGDSRGLDPLVKCAQEQHHLFQIAAGYALRRAGDARAERFSINNLRDEVGKKVVELKVTNRDNGFRVSPLFKGDETAHVEVAADKRFHLGDNISARYATIASLGIREPGYRGKGLGGVAIKKACDLMAEMGHSCSTVSTGLRLVAHRLYCHNGYVDRRFPWEYRKRLEKEAARNDTNIRTREYTDANKADVNGLREQYIRNTVGPADWMPRSNFGTWIKIAEDEGKIVGYTDVYLDPFEPTASINHLHVDADFHDELSVAKVLISGAQEYALAEGKETISFRDPPMRYRDTLMGMGYHIEPGCIRYGWVNMLRVIDLARFLREISDLLSLRLRRSPHAGWSGSMALSGSRLKATIEIDSDGDVSVMDDAAQNADLLILMDDARITSLVSGNEDIWESYRQNTLTIRPMFNERVRGLIESLFPMMPHKQGGWW